jgi:signal transduction histidine kinase
VVEESARPYSAYDSFHAAERAYTKGYASIKQGDVLVPSPLLTYLPTNVLLHFQFGEDGKLSSPQVPLDSQRRLAQVSYISSEQIDLAAGRLAALQKVLNQPAGPNASALASSLSRSPALSTPQPKLLNNRDVLINTCARVPTNTVNTIDLAAQPQQQQAWQSPQNQMLRNSAEWNARANVSQQKGGINEAIQSGKYVPPEDHSLLEGPFKAVWLGPALILARRVEVNSRAVIQGCWVDWEKLRASLLESAKDLFPSCDMQPISAANSDSRDTRRLAALPARLIPGPLAIEPVPFWSPVRVSLVIAWCCVLLAAMAVAVLLNGAILLSERRGAFVSAVTHELRTPLTTFKMYSEMLAEGMIPEEEKRQQYLNTLRSEANRLSHLVENVLAYARLERGSARGRVEKVNIESLIDRVKPRLVQRAEQAGMRLVIDSAPETLQTTVHADVSAVEQILFNLVDNACKYAAPAASEKLIHLEALPSDTLAMLRIRDHGQGITRARARRLFRPFSKSAQEAAHTAPGVGLGLALCRRLSRSMGGDLRLDEVVKDGACFVLTLPVAIVARR